MADDGAGDSPGAQPLEHPGTGGVPTGPAAGALPAGPVAPPGADAARPGDAAASGRGSTGRRVGRREVVFGAVLLAPALVLLGALVAYPIVYTIVRSLFGRT